MSKMVKRMRCTKTRNTGTPEHRNTGTPEHRNTETLWNTPEHPRAPRNTGTAKKPRNTEFDDVVLFSHYRPCRKKVKRKTERENKEIKIKKGRNK